MGNIIVIVSHKGNDIFHSTSKKELAAFLLMLVLVKNKSKLENDISVTFIHSLN